MYDNIGLGEDIFMIKFVRHGETEYNVLGISQGQLDIPLNEKGLMQAEEISLFLKDYHFDVIYTSPLIRAKKTAEIINKYHNVKIVVDDRLKEFFAGRRQGTKSSDWTSEMNEDFMLHPEKYGAESNEGFYNRCVEAYLDLPADKEVLVVAHASVYKNILRYKEGQPFNPKFKIAENAEVLDISKE